MKINPQTVKTAAIVAGAALVAYLLWRARGLLAGATVGGVATGAVNAVGSAARGVVVGVGNQFGIPDTDEARCREAKAAGNTFQASLYCTAGDFIGSLFGIGEGPDPEPVTFNPYAPGDVRTDYVTKAPGAAPIYDYSLDSYLKNGSFPTPGAPR